MHQKKQLTPEQREAIAAKYQRRIIELGTPIFGPPEEAGLHPPNAKSQELQRRIIDASIQLLEAVPPDYEGTAPHRKPGDLNRTAERLLAEEVDLPAGFDRKEEAALFDQHAELERQKIAFGQQMDGVTLEAIEGLIPILEIVKNFASDVFHEMKRWAEEDPEGPGAALYDEMNRAWRQGAGRSRKRT
ncbi:MAG TPA: hypothetical protein VH087_21420 [Thermoanaerobaculia bacterium]|jgi:hypothetical protein|nr:hypothetical protein [Thermoanaerobaculia bacterium]